MNITREGDDGPAVKTWQRWLAGKGHKVGRIDGDHGPATEKATKDAIRDLFNMAQDAISAAL